MSDTHAVAAVGATDLHGSLAPASTEVVKLLTRVSLGWFLLHQGWGKVLLVWNGGLGAFYLSDAYQGREPSWLPDLISLPYAYALPWVEVLLGILIVAGLFNRVVMAAAAVVFFSIAVALWNGGSFFPRHTLMVFLPLALYFMLTGPGRCSVDSARLGRQRPTRIPPARP